MAERQTIPSDDELLEAVRHRLAAREVVKEFDRLFRERPATGEDAQNLLYAVKQALYPQHK